MRKILEQQFKSQYNRKYFIDNILIPIFEQKVDNFQIFEKAGVQNIPLNESEKVIAKSVSKYGKFTTKDNRLIDLYEVILHDNKILEKNKVGIGSLIKKQIIGNNAVFVNFAYESPENKNWRFSFIAYDSAFEEGQIITNATNLKRYTYVFGEKEETYKTAIDRFLKLSDQLDIKIDNIKESFAVESMSKSFFDEYKKSHYTNFVNYLINSNFKQSSFSGDDKNIRDFVKKLLGRIVFLYFVQKKGWLGASSTEYNDGDKNFIQNLFKLSGQNETFYSIWLSKLFFDTLNIKRNDDNFEMPDSNIVKVPYLNGGLFEKDSDKYDYITFPPDLFKNLFDFFDQYNFTVYEDSPGDHTIAVDPEMLGHIFENLLEDNKDKGAFYTPKEIVHYMTQESLIEYLHTHLPHTSKDLLNSFVKNKENSLSSQELQEIDNLLDKVKICDPAIGSGAFPMGLLQEIFALKEIISFQNKDKVWNPANVKENIIQNSIYGVDIEKGAVDIARLRFWLSLIVDEEKPKPLPNLDYKIVVGNSLVSKFEDEVIEIDWSEDTSKEGLFGYELIKDKIKLLNNIVKKQKEYFNSESYNKKNLSTEIKKLKAGILAIELKIMIETQDLQSNNKMLNGKIVNAKKQAEKFLEISGWKNTLNKLKKIIENPELPFEHFDWKLDFPEILNPLVSGKNVGFDIVIGNPPYGVSLKGLIRTKIVNNLGQVPDYEIYYYFIEISRKILNLNGIKCFIIPNTLLFNVFAKKYRIELLKKWAILEILDCTNFSLFEGATVRNIITFFSMNFENDNIFYKNTNKSFSFTNLISRDKLKINKNILIQNNNNWGLVFKLDDKILKIISKIKNSFPTLQSYFPDVSQGLIAYDKYKGQDEDTIKNRIFHYTALVKDDLKPWLWGEDITRYNVKWNQKEYIDYCSKIANPRDPKFFRGERILIREITNPRIFASITDEELYNDPSILIILHSENFHIKALLGILNSRFATFYHFNSSPKATKGAFPKILIDDINNLPLPNISVSEIDTFIRIIDKIIEKKKIGQDTQELEDQIDKMVYELYELTPEEIAIVEGKENSSPSPFSLKREGEQELEI